MVIEGNNNICNLLKSDTFSSDSGYEELYCSSDSISSDSILSDNDSLCGNDNITVDTIEVVECVVDSIVNTVKKPSKNNQKLYSRKVFKNDLTKKNIELRKKLKKLGEEIKLCKINNYENIVISDSKVEDNQLVLNDNLMIEIDVLLDNKHLSCELKVGDILYKHCMLGLSLLGVYIGENTVLCITDFSNFPWGSLFMYIKTEPTLIQLDIFNNKNDYLIVERSNDNIARDRILLEMKNKNEGFNYHVFFSNGEHFVNMVTYGVSDSSIVRNRMTLSVLFISGIFGVTCIHNPIMLCGISLLGGTIVVSNLLRGYMMNKKKKTHFFILDTSKTRLNNL